jgi:hypothetical protein
VAPPPPPHNRRKNRKKKKGAEGGHDEISLVFWNPRGVMNKEVNFKGYLQNKKAIYGGVQESHTYMNSTTLSDGRWRWDAGTEGKPSEKGHNPSRGMGAFIDRTRSKASLVKVGTFMLWHRIELGKGDSMVVGNGYFPNAQDTVGHRKANEELLESLTHFKGGSDLIIFGGDLNAHTASNGDTTEIDEAGKMLLDTVERADMVLVNSMDGICSGGPSRRQVRADGIQESTIDYVICSQLMAPRVKSLKFEKDQMESDHKPMILTIESPKLEKPVKNNMREVWRVSDIPSPEPGPSGTGRRGDWSWVDACQAKFATWISETKYMMRTLNAVGADSQRISDILEWSFQKALDEVAFDRLGTKFVGPKSTPKLDTATNLAIQQREVSEDVMKRIMAHQGATEEARTGARKQFLTASRAVRSAAARRREIAELALFRDVEEKQSDSKLFWSRFKTLRNSLCVNKSPPPVAIDVNGKTATDPWEVLRIWRDFSASIASSDLKGTTEEGIYDEDYEEEVKERLEWLRLIRIHQPELDGVITLDEVFEAIRKLKMGKAPGEDGILTDILKTAADGVNNSKLRGDNTVVQAITLLFNYVLEKEVWPDRWGSGVIFPIHKHDSRLVPSNFRPITLMSVVGKLFGIIINGRLSRFSEKTNTISDEQGGFRPRRGTPDQVFILREMLAARKEKGLATYVTYIDARKAYDTVWREDVYVRIHDSGVKGKLWRQLQAMHSNLSRKVRHPLGDTDLFQ